MSVWARMTSTPQMAVVSITAFSILPIALFYTYFLFPQCQKAMSHSTFRFIVFQLTSFLALAIVWNHVTFTYVGDSLIGLWATFILFAGPIVQKVFRDFNWRKKHRMSLAGYVSYVWKDHNDFYTLKSCVIAPFEEELIYRALSCLVWEEAGISKMKIIFLLPLLFGVSHLHFYFAPTDDGRPRPLAACIGQSGYTTVFGWYVAFVWMRYHSFVTCGLIHCFCNCMGFPDFGGALKWRNPVQKIFINIAYLAGLIGFGGCVGYMATTR